MTGKSTPLSDSLRIFRFMKQLIMFEIEILQTPTMKPGDWPIGNQRASKKLADKKAKVAGKREGVTEEKEVESNPRSGDGRGKGHGGRGGVSGVVRECFEGEEDANIVQSWITPEILKYGFPNI